MDRDTVFQGLVEAIGIRPPLQGHPLWVAQYTHAEIVERYLSEAEDACGDDSWEEPGNYGGDTYGSMEAWIADLFLYLELVE